MRSAGGRGVGSGGAGGGAGVSPFAVSLGLHAAALLLFGGLAVFGYRTRAVPSVDVSFREAASQDESHEPFEADPFPVAEALPPVEPDFDLGPEPVVELETPVRPGENAPADSSREPTGVPPEVWRGGVPGPGGESEAGEPEEPEPSPEIAATEPTIHPGDPGAPTERSAARVAPVPDPSNVAPEYPAAARRRGIEGFVRIRVRVATDGKPLEASVLESSGHRILDDAALRAARAWRYAPACEAGLAVEGCVDLPFRFRLEP